jgi:hypothetical protein
MDGWMDGWKEGWFERQGKYNGPEYYDSKEQGMSTIERFEARHKPPLQQENEAKQGTDLF